MVPLQFIPRDLYFQVAVFLLSIAIAIDWPSGSRRSGQCRQQILPRTPMITPRTTRIFKFESNLFDRFINMVSHIMEPQKNLPPVVMGPINVPGIFRQLYGQLYIKKSVHDHLRESNPVVIKMVSPHPLMGESVFQDWRHRSEDSPRLESKRPGYQTSSRENLYAKWRYHPHSQNYQIHNSISKPSFAFTLNNHAHDDEFYNQQEYHQPYTALSRNHHNEKYQRLQLASTNSQHGTGVTTVPTSPFMHHFIDRQRPNKAIDSNSQYSLHRKSVESKFHRDHHHSITPDSFHPMQSRYRDYASTVDEENLSAISNVTKIEDNPFSNGASATHGKYNNKQVMINDTRVPDYLNYRQFKLGHEIKSRSPLNVQQSGVFHPGSMIKFEINDMGGLHVIPAPNMKSRQYQDMALGDKNNHEREIFRDSVMKESVDSISMRNLENIARGESDTHRNQAQTESQISQISPSKLPPYKEIYESQTSGGVQNITSESAEETSKRNDHHDNHLIVDEIISMDSKTEDHVKTSNATTATSPEVLNSFEYSRRRFQRPKNRTRIIKAIFRRKPEDEMKN